MKIIQENAGQLVLESKVLFGLLGATSYVFDKASGKLKVSGKGLFGSKPQEIALSEFNGVALCQQSMTAAERSNPSAHTFRIELLRASGASFPLTLAYSSGKAGKEKIVEAVRPFVSA